MPQIVIPKNQTCKAGEMMAVMIMARSGNVTVHLKCKTDTSSASYNEVFTTSEYNRSVHGFGGINEDLEALVEILKP